MARKKLSKKEMLANAKKRVLELTQAVKREEEETQQDIGQQIQELFKLYPKFNTKEFVTYVKTNLDAIASKLQWQKEEPKKEEKKTTTTSSSATTQKTTTTTSATTPKPNTTPNNNTTQHPFNSYR